MLEERRFYYTHPQRIGRPTPSWSIPCFLPPPPTAPWFPRFLPEEELISISCINEGNRQRTEEELAMGTGMGMGRVEKRAEFLAAVLKQSLSKTVLSTSVSRDNYLSLQDNPTKPLRQPSHLLRLVGDGAG